MCVVFFNENFLTFFHVDYASIPSLLKFFPFSIRNVATLVEIIFRSFRYSRALKAEWREYFKFS